MLLDSKFLHFIPEFNLFSSEVPYNSHHSTSFFCFVLFLFLFVCLFVFVFLDFEEKWHKSKITHKSKKIYEKLWTLNVEIIAIRILYFLYFFFHYCAPARWFKALKFPLGNHHNLWTQSCTYSTFILYGPFILCRNCVVLPHCTLLHRNCDVTALILLCCMKVKFILTWNAVMLWWLAAESNWYNVKKELNFDPVALQNLKKRVIFFQA